MSLAVEPPVILAREPMAFGAQEAELGERSGGATWELGRKERFVAAVDVLPLYVRRGAVYTSTSEIPLGEDTYLFGVAQWQFLSSKPGRASTSNSER